MEASFICIYVNEQQQELNQQRRDGKKKTTTMTARLGPTEEEKSSRVQSWR